MESMMTTEMLSELPKEGCAESVVESLPAEKDSLLEVGDFTPRYEH